MKQIWRSLFFTIPLATLASFIFITTVRAQSKITPDNSLGAESSVVTPNVVIKGLPSERIDGGATRGANLFHSFQEFNVDQGRGAYFSNPVGIQNILSRVTGSSVSNIFGKLGVLGNANLFFINPNGIIFGPNASLDVNGSFFASTANSLVFDNGFEFSATNPQAPPLLTVNIPIGLRFRDNPGKIQVQGDGQGVRQTPDLIDTTTGLRVPPNQTLALVGGDISLEGATLKTAGGRIELGSVCGNGLVSLKPINTGFSLDYSGVQNFGNIQLSQQSDVDASGEGGGNIQVQGKKITLIGGSQIEASTLGDQLGGTLTVTASDAVELTGSTTDKYSTGLFAEVYSGANGKGGNLIINTGSLSLTGENAGVNVDNYGNGNAGNLTINTQQLQVQKGARVSADTSGNGNAGTVLIQATNSVNVIGMSPNPNHGNSSLSATVDQGATGQGGDLTIKTGSLNVSDNGRVSANTYGRGNAGNLTIDAKNVSVSQSQVSASTFSTGNAGNLTVNATDAVELSGEIPGTGGQLGFPGGLFAQVDLAGTGHAGNLTINTKLLNVSDGSKVQVANFGQSDAGNLFIHATDVNVFETDRPSYFTTVINAGVSGDPRTVTPPKGNGGNLTIETERLNIRNGGQVTADTSGTGNAGNLIIHASDSVQVIGANTFNVSQLGANVDLMAKGNGGNLTIETGRLSVRDGAQVSTSTFGEGNAGNLTVHASDSVELSGDTGKKNPNGTFSSGLFAQVDFKGTGHGGNLTINTKLLNVSDGSRVQVATFGQGDAGNLVIHATDVNVFETDRPGFFITAINAGITLDPKTPTPPQGNGGNLTIETQRLSVRGGGEITSGDFTGGVPSPSTFGNGNAGILRIHASDSVEVVGTSVNGQRQSTVSAEILPPSRGSGGNLEIETGQLSIRDGAVVLVRSQGLGNAGNLTVNARSIRLDNNGTLSADTQSVNTDPNKQQATITLRSGDLILRRNSNITTNARGNNVVGGDINIDTGVLAALEKSNISANSTDFRGGQVRINAQGIFRSSDSTITANGVNSQFNGTVSINSPDVDPSRGLVELPVNVVDPTTLIAQNPCQQGVGSAFVITGRGGLPSNPNQALTSDNVRVDLVTSASSTGNSASTTVLPSTAPIVKRLVPAQGWVFNDKGQVVLTAYDPTNTGSQRSWQEPASCAKH